MVTVRIINEADASTIFTEDSQGNPSAYAIVLGSLAMKSTLAPHGDLPYEQTLVWGRHSASGFVLFESPWLGSVSENLPVGILEPSELLIDYVDKAAIKGLLAGQGVSTLRQVLQLVASSATSERWPLRNVEVHHTKDAEITGWEYVLVKLIFTCPFEVADRYLHELYDRLDALRDRINSEEQSIIQRLIFFDVDTTPDFSSS